MNWTDSGAAPDTGHAMKSASVFGVVEGHPERHAAAHTHAIPNAANRAIVLLRYFVNIDHSSRLPVFIINEAFPVSKPYQHGRPTLQDCHAGLPASSQ